MTSIETHIIIQAPIEEVTSIFFNYQSYQEWNPFLVKFQKYTNKSDPTLNVGDELQIDLKLKGMSHTSTMYPKVLQSSDTILEWKGDLLYDWIFHGFHKFEFKSIDNNKRTVVSQSEKFGGILVYVFKILGLYRKTQESFIEFNEALKDQVEKSINK
ncbi:uncharacterized protein KGF55_001010 [Candida pseudojiufengensis]|uniref:uncharacterized protein n=1 Tax=Candida pseudojiufengensis TaxID=497109 RepID=UPI0022259569|nr:uncharacterized protein KGF55_001010 [Candida pseudojiufengensis]KAI5965648.1 hypothetical protein KGF55_001010 [Candida pseudojiufengensis]